MNEGVNYSPCCRGTSIAIWACVGNLMTLKLVLPPVVWIERFFFPYIYGLFFRILVWIFWTRNVWRHLHLKISCLKPYTQTVARCGRLSQGFPQGSICEFKWPTSCPSFALFPFDWWVNHESGILGEYKARDEGRSIQSHMAKYLAPWAPPPPHQSYLGKKRGSSSHRFPLILPRKRISIWFH